MNLILHLSRRVAPLVPVAVLASPMCAVAGGIANLGTLAGGTFSIGFAVNSVGQVAGDSYVANSQQDHAFRYDGIPSAGGSMHDLGNLNGGLTVALGLNDQGEVAGYSWVLNEPHAYLYIGTPGAGGQMLDLGIPAGRVSSVATAVNEAGQIAGHSGGSNPNDTRAFRFDGLPGAGGIMRELGTLGGATSTATAINSSGEVTGESNPLGSADVHAYRFDGMPGAGGLMHDLGTLGGSYADSFGTSINDIGQVAGYSTSTQSGQGSRAFRYDGTPDVDGVMRQLPTLGGYSSAAYAITNSGYTFGYSDVPGIGRHAALWFPDLSVFDLDVWLDNLNPLDGSKWELEQIESVSESGFATGVGYYNDGPGGLSDGERAFLLDVSSLVPEPESFAAPLFASTLILRTGRRLSVRNSSRR